MEKKRLTKMQNLNHGWIQIDTDKIGKDAVYRSSLFIRVHPWLNYSFGRNVNATAARMQTNAAK
jgi:hypothetical protein